MATKTISITTEAYEKLTLVKEKNESFSDVINRVIGKYSLIRLFGILSKKEADELRMHVNDLRKRMTTDFDKHKVRL